MAGEDSRGGREQGTGSPGKRQTQTKGKPKRKAAGFPPEGGGLKRAQTRPALQEFLVGIGGAVGAYRFVRDVAGTAFHAVVDTELADGAEGFVVKGGDAESSAEFFVELAQIGEMSGESGDLDAFVGEQEFLIAGIPEARELPMEHDGGQDGHLEVTVRNLAEFRATTIFLHANNAARAADAEAEGGEAVHGLLFKTLVNVPHSDSRVRFLVMAVKSRVISELPEADAPGDSARARSRDDSECLRLRRESGCDQGTP